MKQTTPLGIRSTILLALATLAGCAPTYSTASFAGVGEYNPRANDAVADRYRQLQEAPPAQAASVKVLYETLPEGIESKDGVLSVREGYPLTIVGKYVLVGPTGGPWTFSDYKSTSRKVYCYWQAPVTWVTLGLWSLLSPVSYPCWTKDLSQEEWIDELRLLAVAAGGNLVIASPHGGAAQGVIIRATPEYLERLSRLNAPPTPATPNPAVKQI